MCPESSSHYLALLRLGKWDLYLLSCRAAASHVQLSATCHHDDSVVVAARSAMICIGLDLDVVYVLAPVCLLPQLLHDLVDV